MTIALSSHGTMVAVQLTPGGSWTDIAELGDVTPPEMFRNEFDASVQNRNIDDYILGPLRRNAMPMPLNFLPANNTHDHLTGVYKLLIDNTVTGWKVTLPSSVVWIMSGQVKNIAPKEPVDGKSAADVTIRFSGLMSIGGVSIGA